MVRRLGTALAGMLVVGSLVGAGSAAHGEATDTTDVPIDIVRRDGPVDTPAYTDPDLTHTALQLLDYGPSDPYVASWTLEEADGTTVVGPTSAAEGSGLLSFDVDLAHQGGAGLTGDYVLRVTNTVQTPDGPRTGTETTPVTLALDPPLDQPVGTVLDDAVRLAGNTYVDNAAFEVPAIDPGAGRAELVIRNADGTVVFRDDQLATSGTYRWSWDGYHYRANGGRAVPSGTYTASAVVPDHYGRRLDVRLGQVRVYYWLDDGQHRVRKAVSTRLTAPAHGSASRIFHLRLPSRPGRVERIDPSIRVARPHVPAHIALAVRLPQVSQRWSTGSWRALDAADGPRTAGLRVDVRVTVRHRTSVVLSHVRASYLSWHWGL